MTTTPRTDDAKHAYNEQALPITNIFAPMAEMELELAALKTRLRFAEDTCSACHSAMLGKVHPKHPAWAMVYAVQDRATAALKAAT